MNKLLILGSEGFIGSHAVTYFRSLKFEVTCADIVLKQEPGYIIINPEMPDFTSIFNNQAFDVCINATGAANVQLSFAYPAMDYILNTANVYNILDSIRQYNPSCKFINLSSAAIYGNPITLPVKETQAVQPVSPYGYHKWYSEQLCKQFHVLYKMPTVSLRIFSAYGEGLKKQLFWDLYKKATSGHTHIELFGTGKETRDFIYIDDIMQAMTCVINKASFTGEAINVASGKESAIEEMAFVFLNAFGAALPVKFIGNNKMGDPLHWCADINCLLSLGFRPVTSINVGIAKVAAWLKNLN